MRIHFNSALRRFEAQLQSGDAWRTEQQAVQAAGFKCDGPPGWVWSAVKSRVLETLRTKHRPADLIISQEALAEFLKLQAVEAANAEVLAKGKELKKARLKAAKEAGTVIQDGYVVELTGVEPDYWRDKEYLSSLDVPEEIRLKVEEAIGVFKKFVRPVHPGPFCLVCGDPVYFFEQQIPPVCFICEVYPVVQVTDSLTAAA